MDPQSLRRIGQNSVCLDKFYAKSHEWIDVEGTTATLGISDFAQKELGDVVYVDLPEVHHLPYLIRHVSGTLEVMHRPDSSRKARL